LTSEDELRDLPLIIIINIKNNEEITKILTGREQDKLKEDKVEEMKKEITAKLDLDGLPPKMKIDVRMFDLTNTKKEDLKKMVDHMVKDIYEMEEKI
jgi:hypothetical protein